ncbi:MAG: histidinol-phosphate transaminase [Opitutales bacterium]
MKKTFDVDARTLPHIRRQKGYEPGEQPRGEGWVKLNTNENPYPPSPVVEAAVLEEIKQLRLYPEPLSRKLRASIAEHYGMGEKNVIIGNGSDDLLDMITRVFVDASGAGQTVPSYSLYPVLVGLAGKSLLDVSFDRSMRLDVDAIAATGASVFFLTAPNAPTGVSFSTEEIADLLERFDGLLVVDEAYADFGEVSMVPLLSEYENLVVVRTFSKSYGLAGARVGYALAGERVIAMLDRVRDAYNVDRMAQAAALAAFEDKAYFEARRAEVVATREATRRRLDAMGWFTYPSAANFLFTEPLASAGEGGPEVADSLFRFLRDEHVLVRYFPKHPLTCAFLRISIGTDAQMEVFFNVLEKWRKTAARS